MEADKWIENWKSTIAPRNAAWSPGSEAPGYLDGSMPGDYGFDPLGLGSNPEDLLAFREYEVLHSRWAMLGVAGVFFGELFTGSSWADAPKWMIDGSHAEYLGLDLGPTTAAGTVGFQLVTMFGAEAYRLAEPDFEKRVYPGDTGFVNFDPLKISQTKDLNMLKLRELQAGRLAMLAIIGAFVGTAATGLSATQNLATHVADPWQVNLVTSNPFAIPYAHGAEWAAPDFADKFNKAAFPGFYFQ